MSRIRNDNDGISEKHIVEGVTYGDLKVYGFIANLSVDHRGLQERSKEEELFDLSCSCLQNGQQKAKSDLLILVLSLQWKHNSSVNDAI